MRAWQVQGAGEPIHVLHAIDVEVPVDRPSHAAKKPSPKPAPKKHGAPMPRDGVIHRGPPPWERRRGGHAPPKRRPPR